MIEGTFEILFTGKIVKDKSEAEVKQNLQTLFKASPQAIDKLFVGQSVPIKKGLDYATAMKYQSALRQAGALTLINEVKQEAGQQSVPPSSAPPADRTESSVPHKATSPTQPSTQPSSPTPSSHTQAAPASASAAQNNEQPQRESEAGGSFSLAPVGSDMAEKRQVDPVEVPDLSHLDVAPVGADMGQAKAHQQAVNPDVSHLQVAEVGEDLSERKPRQQREIDTSELDLAPAGADLSEKKEKPKLPEPDISGLSLD